MFKKVKLMCALVLMACLFLPLSTCTKLPHPTAVEQEVEVFERYVVMPEKGAQGYSIFHRFGPAIVFILPLLFSLAALFRAKASIFYALVDLSSALALLFVVAGHAVMGNLVLGGYLAASFGACYFILALMLLFVDVRQRLREKEVVMQKKA